MPSEPLGTSIPAGESKTHCLRLIYAVYKTGNPITITKHGKPMVELMPKATSAPTERKSLFGRMAGTIAIHGGIFSWGRVGRERRKCLSTVEWKPCLRLISSSDFRVISSIL